MSSIISKSNKLDYIQAMRGIAAMAVVVCHLRDLFHGTPYSNFVDRWMLPGAYGVDLFFMISGFIITYTGMNYTSHDSWKFLVKRMLRIWPPYAIWTLIYVVYFYGMNVDSTMSENIVKSLLFIPLNFDSALYFGSAVLPPGWTLNYEMYFYLVFAVCLMFGRFRFIVMGMWFLITLLSVPYLLNLSGYKPAFIGGGYLNLMMQSLIFEFLFGVICALIYKNGNYFLKSKFQVYPCLILSLTIPMLAYIFGIKTQDHGPANFGMFLIPSFLLIVLCGKYIEENFSIPKILTHIGDVSFSLYLCHIVVINVVYVSVSHFIDDDIYKGIATIIITIPFSIFVSSVSYKYIEGSLHSSLDRLFFGKKINRAREGA
ncbi:acyltransferase family protein [Citrobacter braakii]|uniref:acyltransferase family protein n=1 Tax=Citrobacter braakii TaxID=57706 RepID=UPI003C2DCEAF